MTHFTFRGPFDAAARDAGFEDTALPLTPASVLYAIHGPDSAADPVLAKWIASGRSLGLAAAPARSRPSMEKTASRT